MAEREMPALTATLLMPSLTNGPRLVDFCPMRKYLIGLLLTHSSLCRLMSDLPWEVSPAKDSSVLTKKKKSSLL